MALAGTKELTQTELSDRQLLHRFSQSKCQQSFTELVVRHGGLVMGVCRRHLPREQDAEDAFQTTFLVLAQKANSVSWRECIAPWLYTTATSVSRNFRRRIINRRETDANNVDPEDQSLSAVTNQESREIFDEELSRIPKQYRDPLVLFHLEGKSRDDIARLLGLTLAAVKTRLERGRKKLRVRMALRGAPLIAAALLVQQSQQAAAAVIGGSALVQTTSAIAAGASCSATILQLANQEIQTMTYSSLLAKGLIVSTVASCLVAVPLLSGVFGPGEATGQQPPRSVVVPATQQVQERRRSTTFVNQATTTLVAQKQPARSKTASQPKSTLMGQSRSVAKIQDELVADTKIDFIETPLSDAAQFISEIHDIQILLDHRALEQEGVDDNSPLSISVQGVSLKSALRLMLEQHDLVYTIHNDVLLFTTQKAAPNYDQIWIHEIGNHDLAEAQQMVEDFFGEDHRITCNGRGTSLIVKAPMQIQEDIAKFFEDLDDHDRQSAK